MDEDDHYALRVVEIPANKWVRRYRSVVFQMVLLSFLAFSGPSMSNAINSLGGGGLATPWTANTATAVQYSTSVLIAMFGGPIISLTGIPIACMIGAVGFPLSGSGFYVNSKYGVQWYLIFAKAIYGVTSAFLYVAESTAMISYPEEHRRGLYISIWVTMRTLGSILGGAITFGLNIAKNGAGGVSTNTYLVFLGLECLGVPAALLFTRTRKVIRSDGWDVPRLPRKSWKKECKLLLAHHMEKRTLLLIPIYILTYFGDGVWGTYHSQHFSVRTRALGALIGHTLAAILNPFFGLLLDMKSVGPRRKGMIAFFVWVIPTLAMLIWVMINIRYFETHTGAAIDFTETGTWLSRWIPWLIYITLVYWVLGQFASDVGTNARTGGVFRSWETVGQAISYGINSKASNQYIPFGLYFGIFIIATPLFWVVLMQLPVQSRIPQIMDDDGHVIGQLGKAIAMEDVEDSRRGVDVIHSLARTGA
ncbi:duf895 domain protein membrane protein [Thozetella sp. PMI_491]|nr:duf895 domain protein membrane protein [Thozetella sp. PMI_491]